MFSLLTKRIHCLLYIIYYINKNALVSIWTAFPAGGAVSGAARKGTNTRAPGIIKRGDMGSFRKEKIELEALKEELRQVKEALAKALKAKSKIKPRKVQK